MDVDDVWERLRALRTDLVVISGGEPMMQQEALAPLVESLTLQGVRVEIETNGTIRPTITPTRFNVSPKLAHSGVLRKKAIKPALAAYVGQSVFKFVCHTLADLDEVTEVQEFAGIPDPDIWVMPEGRDPVTLQAHTDALADEVIARGWNLTPRLHVMIWGSRRGV
jgi:organic radical activating enzyme